MDPLSLMTLNFSTNQNQNSLFPSLQTASFSATAISQHFSLWLTYFHITLQIRTDCRHICIHTPLTFYLRPQLKEHLQKSLLTPWKHPADFTTLALTRTLGTLFQENLTSQIQLYIKSLLAFLPLKPIKGCSRSLKMGLTYKEALQMCCALQPRLLQQNKIFILYKSKYLHV